MNFFIAIALKSKSHGGSFLLTRTRRSPWWRGSWVQIAGGSPGIFYLGWRLGIPSGEEPEVKFNQAWASVISPIGTSSLYCCLSYVFLFFCSFLTWYFFSLPPIFLAIEADEVSNEEEAHFKDVINYHIHTYSNLVTPAWLYQCGFGPDLAGNAPTFLTFVFPSFLILNHSFLSCQLLTLGSLLV